MFFELTNSLVTFQTMMNNLLRNIIEVGDIIVFINNMIVEIKMEKEYNNIVKEVLKMIIENNLFVKPEKCIQKIKEVGFLEVIIEPDKVKIEKEKIQRVID